jgi:hypothetical protein
MAKTKRWTAEIVLDETEDRTDATVRLRMGDTECVAIGRARRNRHDPNIPRIGEELATARALADLSAGCLTSPRNCSRTTCVTMSS